MTYQEYMRSPRWAALRQRALVRDRYRCRCCGTDRRLEVHHVRYGDPLGSEDVADLLTLCGGPDGCHHAVTQSIRRRRSRGDVATKSPTDGRAAKRGRDAGARLLHAEGVLFRGFGGGALAIVLLGCLWLTAALLGAA